MYSQLKNEIIKKYGIESKEQVEFKENDIMELKKLNLPKLDINDLSLAKDSVYMAEMAMICYFLLKKKISNLEEKTKNKVISLLNKNNICSKLKLLFDERYISKIDLISLKHRIAIITRENIDNMLNLINLYQEISTEEMKSKDRRYYDE